MTESERKNIDNYYRAMATDAVTVTVFSDTVKKEVEKKKTEENDPVNHPTHYTSHPSGIECINIAKWYDFCIGNCIKYIWRAGLKKSATLSDKEKELEDLKKARWYLDKEIQEKEKELKN